MDDIEGYGMKQLIIEISSLNNTLRGIDANLMSLVTELSLIYGAMPDRIQEYPPEK